MKFFLLETVRLKFQVRENRAEARVARSAGVRPAHAGSIPRDAPCMPHRGFILQLGDQVSSRLVEAANELHARPGLELGRSSP